MRTGSRVGVGLVGLFFVMLFVNPAPSWAAYSRVDSVSAGSSDGGNSVTTGAIDTSGANLIVCAVSSFTGSNPTPTDSKSNTYTGLTESGSANVRTKLFYVFNPTVGSGHTFSASAAVQFPSIACIAFSGSVTSPLDQQNGAGSGGSTVASQQPGSVTPTENNELLVTCLGLEGTISGLTINSSFTNEQEVSHQNDQHFGLAIGFLIQGTAAAVNPTWSWTTNRAAAARIATFKDTPGGGATPRNLMLLGVGP